MPHGPEYTLAEFIRELIASPEEWQNWERVRSAEAPGSRPVLPKGPYDQFYHEPLPASPEFRRREELQDRFIEAAREHLLSGRWEVRGRTAGPATRQTLEAVDLERAGIHFVENAIGPFRHIAIRPRQPRSNKEVLQLFIETVCRAAGEPGKKLSKSVIDDLAQALCPDNYTSAAFLAAWEDAPIEKWKEPGRR